VEDETGDGSSTKASWPWPGMSELALAWDVDDQVGRRLAAVQLVWIKAAKAVQVAAAFGGLIASVEASSPGGAVRR
jgi:hypothetical protein